MNHRWTEQPELQIKEGLDRYFASDIRYCERHPGTTEDYGPGSCEMCAIEDLQRINRAHDQRTKDLFAGSDPDEEERYEERDLPGCTFCGGEGHYASSHDQSEVF